MNRQEVLHGLNNAVTLFKQQEALSQEYERVQQKDRPYEEKRKIGWLGIIILGFEIYYGGMMIFVSLFNIVNNVEEQFNIEIPVLLEKEIDKDNKQIVLYLTDSYDRHIEKTNSKYFNKKIYI